MKSLFLLACLAVALDGQSPEIVPHGAKVYVSAAAGFEIYLTAAAEKKRVPVVFTTDSAQADYELESVSLHVNPLHWQAVPAPSIVADWMAPVMPQLIRQNDEASVRLVNLRTRAVVFAYSVNRNNSFHGSQTAAESCAKHLRAAMKLPGGNFR